MNCPDCRRELNNSDAIILNYNTRSKRLRNIYSIRKSMRNLLADEAENRGIYPENRASIRDLAQERRMLEYLAAQPIDDSDL